MTEKPHPSRDPALRSAAAEIADALGETDGFARTLVARIVRLFGTEQALVLLARTLEVEAAGGMLTMDGSRRRTTGGVFFRLAGDQMTAQQRWRVFRFRRPSPQGTAPEALPPAQRPALAFEDRIAAAKESAGEKGRATVKVTLIGRPGRIVTRDGCVITTMASRPAPSLPKGLPMPTPEPADCTVYIAAKQWTDRRIADALADQDDALIVEGWATYDPELEGLAVYAQAVTTKKIQAAARRPQDGRAGA